MGLYYTVEELARTLKVSEEAIRKRLRGGEIRGVRVGRTWRVPREQAPLDQGYACESFDPETGQARTGVGFAALAGFIAYALSAGKAPL